MKTFKEMTNLLTEESVRLLPSKRRQVNDALIKAGFDGNGRFASIAVANNAAAKVLGRFGIQIDAIMTGDLFIGLFGNRSFPIEDISGAGYPVPINNSLFAMAWTKLGDHGYEVVAYLS